MNLPHFALTHRSIVLAIAVIVLLVGSFNFGTMPRREDPEITIRDALITTSWPGAPSSRVEELLTEPIEDVLLEIPELTTVESKSMSGLSIIQVSASDKITNTDQVWDDVRAKVDSISHRIPQGASPPSVDSDFGDVYEIVFALYEQNSHSTNTHKTYSPRELEKFAERLEDEVERIDDVAKVELWGIQPERIYIEFDSSEWAKLGLTASELKELFQARNIVRPGGELDTKTTRYAINPTGEFTSITQMKNLIVGQVDDRPVFLKDLPLTISRRYQEPYTSLTRITTPDGSHKTSIVIGISMKSGRNIAQMNQKVEQAIRNLRASAIPPDIALERVNDLPRQVESRIADFQINLLEGVVIVLGVALLTMGWRPAVIMATAVPLSMIAAFSVVNYFGVELEQFSIASLVIALGMVVDNAIVVSDNTVRLIQQGKTKIEAVKAGAQDLAIPLLTSTLTTMAAFLPMLTIEGNVGEYVSSLPVVVATTLAMSYLVAMLVTPLMCLWLLKSDKEGSGQKNARLEAWLRKYDSIIHWCLARPGKAVGLSGLGLLLSLLLIPIIGTQFFPNGSRDQFFVKIWLPEGASIQETSSVVQDVETVLLEESKANNGEESLISAISFIGTGGPRIMLTQEPEYPYPYYALVLVNTSSVNHTDTYATRVREQLKHYVRARITVDQFMLGPPVKDPVAFRVTGSRGDLIDRKIDQLLTLFKETPGVVQPYSNWGSDINQVEVQVDANTANLAGVTNEDVALATTTVLSGTKLTDYREGSHLIPVLLRAERENRQSLHDLQDIFVNGRYGKVPLASIAHINTKLEPAVLARRNGLPTVTIGARIDPNVLANTVSARLYPKLEQALQNLPPGYVLETDGEREETEKALKKVVLAIGLSIVAMFLILTIQYNSLVKPLVVMATVPLGLIGVLIGLWVTGWSLGFMALLGILSLGGIVINNAIVMVDFIETNSAAGIPLKQAVAEAGRARMRPIILTTLTTIGGLLPLSLFGGALWQPMTNGMIFGLLISTLLTLFVIPSLYFLVASKSGQSETTSKIR
ncbi:efflux RND transporter permease subunit [Vibrio profundum]|uniref:efflux RND transporter permease subunit n=1 Tax=Vibrio profundum TaxID=2910247 RepID=UPI003D0F626E